MLVRSSITMFPPRASYHLLPRLVRGKATTAAAHPFSRTPSKTTPSPKTTQFFNSKLQDVSSSVKKQTFLCIAAMLIVSGLCFAVGSHMELFEARLDEMKEKGDNASRKIANLEAKVKQMEAEMETMRSQKNLSQSRGWLG
ncbi:hypothetical protein HK104_004545 [Borealophlyctis nickersoniae]|nr:hypothetical protein HK104_004545 [Borealophlyctis nickersoniae]